MISVSKCNWYTVLFFALSVSGCARMESSSFRDLASSGGLCRLSPKASASSQKTTTLDAFVRSDRITVDWSAVFEESVDSGIDSVFSKTGSVGERIPAGTEFVVTMERNCALNNPGSSPSYQSLKDSLHNWPIERLTLPWVLDKELDRATFTALVEADPCLIQISEQRFITLSSDFQALNWQDPEASKQGHLNSIHLDRAHDFFYQSNGIQKDVVIAVVDSGVDYTHPDLKDQMWSNSMGQHGFDFVDVDTTPMDVDGHGTHVAGLIGARANNNVGVTGIMGSHVKLMAVRALTATGGVISGSIDSIVNGIQYATDNGAGVINLSLGGYVNNATLKRALEIAVSKNIVVVAAAGNETKDIGAGLENFFAPAGYAKDLSGVISVASLDSQSLKLSSFSNFSSTYVEIAAPGSENSQGTDVGLLSTFPLSLSQSAANSYGRLSGTSMAAPVIAGSVGLIIGYLKTHDIQFSADQLERFLLLHSDRLTSLRGAVKNEASLNLVAVVEGLGDLTSGSDDQTGGELRCP